MSENQDTRPISMETTGEGPLPSDAASPNDPAAAEAQLAAAHAQLLAAQQQLHDAQQRLYAAQAAVDAVHQADEAQHEAVTAAAAAPQPLMQATMPPPASGAAAPEAHAPETPEETPKEPTAPEAPATYGFLNGFFNGFAKLGPIALLIILGCMAWPIFLDPSGATFCPAELKALTAYLHGMATHSWYTPLALSDGTFSLPQWPAFTWCLALLGLIPALPETGLLLPIASFGCTFLAAAGVWSLAMAAGAGSRAALAAGVVLLCAPLFAPMPHFVGPAALAAALLLFALACFCKGWTSPRSWICLPLAFVLTALAGLAGGWMHFAIPLVASFFFLLWRGDFKRAQHLDALLGFILMLAVIGAWLAAIMVGDAKSHYLNLLFANAFQFAWPMPLLWLKPVAAGLVGLLPWLLLIICVAWVRVLARSGQTLAASRKQNGIALIWISLVLALPLACLVPWFHPAAVAICCLAALLLGKAFVNLGRGGNRFFFLLAGLLLIAAGAALGALTFPESQQLILSHLPFQPPVPELGKKLLTLHALRIVGGILAAGGLISLLFVRRYMANGGLIYAAVLVIALSLTARLLLVPELKAMPGTPLVSLAAVEQQVQSALAPKPETPKASPETPKESPKAAADPAPTPAATPSEAGPSETPAAPEQPAEAPAHPSSEGNAATAQEESPKGTEEQTASQPTEAKDGAVEPAQDSLAPKE